MTIHAFVQTINMGGDGIVALDADVVDGRRGLDSHNSKFPKPWFGPTVDCSCTEFVDFVMTLGIANGPTMIDHDSGQTTLFHPFPKGQDVEPKVFLANRRVGINPIDVIASHGQKIIVGAGLIGSVSVNVIIISAFWFDQWMRSVGIKQDAVKGHPSGNIRPCQSRDIVSQKLAL